MCIPSTAGQNNAVNTTPVSEHAPNNPTATNINGKDLKSVSSCHFGSLVVVVSVVDSVVSSCIKKVLSIFHAFSKWPVGILFLIYD